MPETLGPRPLGGDPHASDPADQWHADTPYDDAVRVPMNHSGLSAVTRTFIHNQRPRRHP